MLFIKESKTLWQWSNLFKETVNDRDWLALRASKCREPYHTGLYVPPTHIEIKTLINGMHWTEENVARIVGAPFDTARGRGSNTVRGWLRPPGTAGSRNITYASWRLLLINAKFADA